jgi:L-fuconate dehydratase
MADEQQFRWLGPHKGVVHLALSSVTNACWDLWAKKRGVPLWKLLLDLTPEQLVATLDLSYLEDELTTAQAVALLRGEEATRESRMQVLKDGYPGYDTSVGWFNYSDEQVRENCKKAIAAGFTAMKLKVGAKDAERDIRRAMIVREAAGPDARVMVDANQQWTLPQALDVCARLSAINPFWIEEPTHPDDVLAHKTLADAIAPVKLALGEHVPNRVIFKNYLQTGSAGFIQVDAVRVAGVSEFLAVSLLSRKFGIPVVPHVGDMGQLHQHLVLFNHIGMGHQALFLEHIPHLRPHFVHPVHVECGVYRTPQEPGSGCDLK